MIVWIEVAASVEKLPWIADHWLVLQLLRDWVQLGCHFTPHHYSLKPHWFAIESAVGNVIIGRSVSHHFINTRLGLVTVNNSLPLLSRLLLYNLSVLPLVYNLNLSTLLLLFNLSMLRYRFDNILFKSGFWSKVRNGFFFCLRVHKICQCVERGVVCNFTFTRDRLTRDVFTCWWVEFLVNLLLSFVVVHFSRESFLIVEKLLFVRISLLSCTLSSVFSFRLVKIFKRVIFFEWLRSCPAFCTRLLLSWERFPVYEFLTVGLYSLKFIRYSEFSRLNIVKESLRIINWSF